MKKVTERRNLTKRTGPIIKGGRAVENLYRLQLMAVLRELVRDRGGYKGAALVLGIDQRTVSNSVRSGWVSNRTRKALERVLQYGVGSAADEQRERSDKLEARLDKMEGQFKELKADLRSGLKVLHRLEGRLAKAEGQVKELKGDRRSGLKGLRMSLEGVRKYYGVQRRLIEQRLLVLEAGRDGTESGASVGDES